MNSAEAIEREALNARQTIRVLVAEDNVDMADALIEMLNGEPGFECAGAVRSVDEVISRASTTHADVVLLDLLFTDGAGLGVIQPLRQALPGTRVVVHSGMTDQETIDQATRLGASAFLIKGSDVDVMFDTLRKAMGKA